MPIQWTRQNCEELIALYKKHESLWNSKHPGYVDRYRREKSFNVLLTIMKKSVAGLTLTELKSKVLSLRSQFRKEYRAVLASRRSGANPSDVRTPKLWSYDLLDFLIPSLRTNETCLANFTETTFSPLQFSKKATKKEHEEYSDVDESLDELDESLSNPSTLKRTQEQRSIRARSDPGSEICELVEFLEKKTERKYEWLGEQVVQTLNEMTNQDVIDETIIMIQRQIMESKIKDRTNVVYTEADYD